MGWSSCHATYYKNGKVDRKAEMDSRWTQSEHDGYPELNVKKSSMVGTTYYAAIEVKRSGVVEKVFATVALTSTERDFGINFSYKDMDESMLPYCFDCPVSILKLLTPTNDVNSNEWRRLCNERRESKKNKPSLGSLPIGTVISWKDNLGNEHKAYKHTSAYQFKKPFWMNINNDYYIQKRHIPDNFIIISN